MYSSKIFLSTGLLVLSLLTGCTTELIQESKDSSDQVEAKVKEESAVFTRSVNPSVVVDKSLYFGSQKSKRREEVKLPKQMYQPIAISAGNAMTLAEMSELVYLSTGLKLYYTPDALKSLSGQGNTGSAGVIAVADSAGGGTANASGGAQGSTEDILAKYSVQLLHHGSLKKLLDTLSSRTNLFWEWDGERVKIYRQKTQTYTLKAFAGKTNLTTTIVANVTKSGASDTQLNNQSTGMDATGLSVWNDIQGNITAMLSPDARISVATSIGAITVTDTPYVLAKVSEYVDAQNNSLTKQIRVRVEIYEVESNREDDVGIDWSFMKNTAKYSLSFLSNAFPSSSEPNVSVGVVDPNSSINGSESFLTSLRTRNRVTQVTTEDIITLNAQPVPVRVQTEQGYLERAETTTTQDTTTTALIPGTVTSGISMIVLPKVVNQKQIMLQFSLDISNLDNLLAFSSGDTTIQLPTVSVKNFMQRVMMRSGNTVVITGFENNRNSDDYNGVLEQSFSVAGGRVQGSKKRKSTLIMITPVLLEV